MPGLFGAPRHHLDLLEAERCAGVDQEGGLGLVGFDQRHVEIGPGDLDREARQAGARADIDQVVGTPEVVDEDEAVFDERPVRARHEARPRRNQSNELIQLRILH